MYRFICAFYHPKFVSFFMDKISFMMKPRRLKMSQLVSQVLSFDYGSRFRVRHLLETNSYVIATKCDLRAWQRLPSPTSICFKKWHFPTSFLNRQGNKHQHIGAYVDLRKRVDPQNKLIAK